MDTPAESSDRNFTHREAAAYLRIAPITLLRLRKNMAGPYYSRIGRKIIYRKAELDQWLAGRSTRAHAP